MPQFATSVPTLDLPHITQCMQIAPRLTVFRNRGMCISSLIKQFASQWNVTIDRRNLFKVAGVMGDKRFRYSNY